MSGKTGIRPAFDFDVESPLAIELRRILIRLDREMDLDRKRLLMITSSERGEGKSLFSLHFALVLAHHTRKRILLVDGDLRRPVQHTAFGVEKRPGLGDMLAGHGEVAPRETGVPGLWFLPAGERGDRPSELLAEESVREVFQRLRADFDIVVLDCPPVVPVSDPLQYGTVADGTIYLVMAGRTVREVCRRGIGILRSAGINIVGIVANNLGEVLPYYYDHKYYGYEDRRRN